MKKKIIISHADFLSLALGHSLQECGYYREVFSQLFKHGCFYPKDTEGWAARSMEKWRRKLIELKVLSGQKRKGFGSAVYYEFHPILAGYLEDLAEGIRAVSGSEK